MVLASLPQKNEILGPPLCRTTIPIILVRVSHRLCNVKIDDSLERKRPTGLSIFEKHFVFVSLMPRDRVLRVYLYSIYIYIYTLSRSFRRGHNGEKSKGNGRSRRGSVTSVETTEVIPKRRRISVFYGITQQWSYIHTYIRVYGRRVCDASFIYIILKQQSLIKTDEGGGGGGD